MIVVPSASSSRSRSFALFSSSPETDRTESVMLGRENPVWTTLASGMLRRERMSLDHRRRRRRRQGQHGRPAQVVDGVAERQEVGAEVVAPLADAVGLVHDEQADGPAP